MKLIFSKCLGRKTVWVFLAICIVFVVLVALFFVTRPSPPTMSSSASSLEFWMTNLPPKLRQMPVIHLAIPGSHDSGTSQITPSSDIAPDADTLINDLRFLGPILRDVLANWSLTQPYPIKQQLYAGIRYLDLRIATRNGTDKFYFVHNLYSDEADKDFVEINDFLETHPNEIVFLDFQHFHAMQDGDHRRFKELVVSVFGQKLQPYVENMTSVTLDSMAASNRQVIVIYREAPPNLEATFWPTGTLPNPWANTYAVPKLIQFLTDQLKTRDSSVGYVSQVILTPDTAFILEHVASDLKSKCFLTLEEEKYKWLNGQQPGPGGVNIVICDFVEYNNEEFAKSVIALNDKLL